MAIAADTRFNSITKSPNFENEKKLILKPEMVRAELQCDYSLGLSKDEHDSIQNQFNSPKLEQCFKENDMVRAELQCEDPFCFNTDSISRPHYEWGNSERNSNHVIRMPDKIAVHSRNTKDRCPIPASQKCLDSDSSAYILSGNFSPRVSCDSSSDDVVVENHENDHDMSLHQHKFEEEENKERSEGTRKDCPPISDSEDNSALKGSQRGNMVKLKSSKQKQTNINPSMGTVLSESVVKSSNLSHPRQHTVDAENKEYKNPVHPDYVHLLSGIDSYTRWPTHHIQTPQIMAEAGFFYTGSKDCTCCFQCGVILRNWEPGDNPWIEHARCFPHCTYVLGKKGQKHVNAVLSKVEQRSESSSMTTISTIRKPGTAFNLEFDSLQESGSQSGRQETTIKPAEKLLLPDKERGSRPGRQSNSAAVEELTEMRPLYTVSEDNNPLPLPTGIPTTTTTESNQSRLNISNPMKSTVNLTSSPSFGNHGASENTKAAKSPSSLPQLEPATLPQLGRQETTIKPAEKLLLPDKERGSRPGRQSNSAAMEELTKMRPLFTVSEDNNPLPLPTGIPTTTTTTESKQSRLNISNPMKSTVYLTSFPSFGNHGVSENTKAAKSPSFLP